MTGSVQRRVVRIGGDHREPAALPAQHRPPQPLRLADEDTSPGSDSTTYQAPSVSSYSSWPGPQPAYPAKIRSEPRAAASSSGGVSRSTRPIAPCTRRQPSGGPPSTGAVRPGTRGPRGDHGRGPARSPVTPGRPGRPPRAPRPASPSPSRMSPTPTGVGRFRTTPSEPSSSWSRSEHHGAVEIRVRQGGCGDEQPPCERGHLGHDTHDPAFSPFAGHGRGQVRMDAAHGVHGYGSTGPAGDGSRAVTTAHPGRLRSVL